MIPFSKDVFLGAVERYAEAAWPMQVLAFLLACAIVDLVRKPRAGGSRLACGTLAAGWLWVGGVYYAQHVAALSWAAWIPAGAFTLQGVLLLLAGVVRDRVPLRYERGTMGNAGMGFMLYALFAYPVTALAAGVALKAAPVVGIAPDPTILFTLGLLLLVEGRVPLTLAVIPVAGAAANGVSAIMIGLPADYAMLPAALAAAGLIVVKNRAG